jgi:acyl dehydratase
VTNLDTDRTTREREMVAVPITDEMIENMRSKIGLELQIAGSTNNAEATRHAIVRFAEGIGDDNPLWVDDEYAASGPFGRLAAPPTWVFCCFCGIQFGWPGLGSVHSASEMLFHRVVRLGDVVSVRCIYEGFDGPMPSRFAGRKLIDRFRVEYRNHRGEPVADHLLLITRFERGAARQGASRRAIELPHPWTPAELAAIDEEVLAERPRGAEPRWWNDVAVGDELDQATRGPIGLTDEIAFVSTGAAPIPRIAAHGAALRKYRQQPKWAFRDPTTHAWEPLYSVHYNAYAARQQGAQDAYDVGPQRMSWQVTMLTNWGGDRSFVKRIDDAFKGFVYLSDVVRLGGRITDKYIDDDGDAVVAIETWAVDQRGTNVMPGSAVLALPSREGRDPIDGR